MKLAVLGGGGVRSPFLAKSIALGARNIGITETVFMDIDEEKLFIYGKIAKKISELIDPELKFSLTTDSVEALTDADFVITTIRAEGDEGRVFDERSALNEGVLGQETTGAGGFFCCFLFLSCILVLHSYQGLFVARREVTTVILAFADACSIARVTRSYTCKSRVRVK